MWYSFFSHLPKHPARACRAPARGSEPSLLFFCFWFFFCLFLVLVVLGGGDRVCWEWVLCWGVAWIRGREDLPNDGAVLGPENWSWDDPRRAKREKTAILGNARREGSRTLATRA